MVIDGWPLTFVSIVTGVLIGGAIVLLILLVVYLTHD
jgi:hypothetical protein